MTAPQFDLFAEARPASEGYVWHFALQASDGSLQLDVTDQEIGAPVDRLELLAVVRGLEALDQPSCVNLVTPSRYVSHGLRHGLSEWRVSAWQWESFGRMTSIKHEDLWKRVDLALSFHRVHCRMARVDQAHGAVPAPAFARHGRSRSLANGPHIVAHRREKVNVNVRTPWLSLRRRVADVLLGLGEVIAPQVSAIAS